MRHPRHSGAGNLGEDRGPGSPRRVFERRNRVRRLTLTASVDEYAACIDQALRDARPAPESFHGADHAAAKLLEVGSDNQLFICGWESLARALAFSFTSPARLVGALADLEESTAVVRFIGTWSNNFLHFWMRERARV